MLAAKLLLGTAAAAALVLNCPTSVNSDPQKKESTTFEEHFLDLSGVMTIGDEKIANYSVYIFQDGSPSDTFQVNTRLEQHYMLPLNHNYALKFSRPGYKDRILLVNTHVSEKHVHTQYSFRYQIEFIEENESNTFDDFPVAFIHYDIKQKDFDYNRAYHTNVRTDNPPASTTASSGKWH